MSLNTVSTERLIGSSQFSQNGREPLKQCNQLVTNTFMGIVSAQAPHSAAPKCTHMGDHMDCAAVGSDAAEFHNETVEKLPL